MENDKQREDFLAYRTGGFDMTADWELWQAAQAAQQQEIDKLNAQLSGSVTIVKEKFYPADKEMVEHLRAENERLSAKVAELRHALTLCLGAIIEMTPCAADECKQSQAEWKDEAEKLARKTLASTDTTWLDRKLEEAKREQREQDAKICEVLAASGISVSVSLGRCANGNDCADAIRNSAHLKG